jgi:hypothetical protein
VLAAAVAVHNRLTGGYSHTGPVRENRLDDAPVSTAAGVREPERGLEPLTYRLQGDCSTS